MNSRQTNKGKERQTGGLTDMDGLRVRRIDKQTDRWTDVWMVDRRTDRWAMDGRTDRHVDKWMADR